MITTKIIYVLALLIIFLIGLFIILFNDRNNKGKEYSILKLLIVCGIIELLLHLICVFFPHFFVDKVFFSMFLSKTFIIFYIFFQLVLFLYLIYLFKLKNKNNEVEQLKNQIIELKQAKNSFLTDFSRDIKGPLNAIIGFSECIKRDASIDAFQSDIDNIVAASNNLLEIVDSRLDTSKIEIDKLKLKSINYYPRDIFNEVVDYIRCRTKEKKIEFNVDISNELPYQLYGDSNKIKQMLVSLLANAVKHTEHGFVEFKIDSSNKNGMSELIITIKDTGMGMKDDQLSKIFTNYGDNSSRNLKFSTIKYLVKKMDGSISVHSKYREGTRVVINIKQRIVEDTNIENKKVVDLVNKKVLIVDDNKLNIKVCERILKSYDIEVSSVESGKECIQLLKNGGVFDLILMDDMMPNMSGVETLNNLKTQLISFDTPTVILTANDIGERREMYFDNGFSDCLAKPIVKEELNKVLVKYLGIIKEEKIDDKKEINKVKNEIDLTGKNILLVDDNSLNLKVTENILKIYNPTITSVTSGKECINRVRSSNYDLILLDDMMPEMSGIETMHLLRKIDGFNTPIVIVTANIIDGAKDNYLTVGFDDYLAKPIDREHLVKILKEFIIERKNDNPKKKEDPSIHTIEYLKAHEIIVEDSLEYLKSIDDYNNAVRDFLKTVTSQIVLLNQYKLSHNLSNYAAIVHDLREECQRIGMNKVSNILYNHELKSRNGNVRYIDEHFDELLDIINEAVKVLKKYIGK